MFAQQYDVTIGPSCTAELAAVHEKQNKKEPLNTKGLTLLLQYTRIWWFYLRVYDATIKVVFPLKLHFHITDFTFYEYMRMHY